MLLYPLLQCAAQTTLAELSPVQYALSALQRDWAAAFAPDASYFPTVLRLVDEPALPPEGWHLRVQADVLVLGAADALGMAYGLYEISHRLLGIEPFWFWNDQRPEAKPFREIDSDLDRHSTPARVRWRGWFINDETLLDHWQVAGRADLPWQMAFEALLRCGGNLIIPGTDKNAKRWRKLASDMGLVITHHHAEPLGAEMFARAYPDEVARFDRNAEKFRGLWRDAIQAQRGMRVIWNIGFRGQGDRPFWEDDPQYDTPAARGALMSRLILEQYRLVKEADPNAVCCTNLYGETMELYRDGHLKLPEDVIKIWADNGYGKMVSRRQGNDNPRVTALPDAADTGLHGLYYHASFYDLQAASHITMLPNSVEFVRDELTAALDRGVTDYWLVNCSNIKPHVYVLDAIAQLWCDGSLDPNQHRQAYTAAYYGTENAPCVARCLTEYAQAAVQYGPNADDHAGDQFYNHVPRMLISQFLRDRTAQCTDLLWLSDAPTLEQQLACCATLYAKAVVRYTLYLAHCEMASAELHGAAKRLFADSVYLQAKLYALWADGAHNICAALTAGFARNWQQCFYRAGKAQQCFLQANAAMRHTEHGRWVGFYANECQTDVEQTAQLCGYLLSFARNMGEGPHFYEWQREFFDSESDRRVLLLLNTEKHPTDAQLWLKMEQRLGE